MENKTETLTDVKKVYPEFKFFKDIYTRMKVSDRVFITSDGTNALICFEQNSPFYKVYGKLEGSTEFLKWINSGHSISMKLEDMNLIAKCLKKNATSIEFSDTYFKFVFSDKEGTPIEILLEDKYLKEHAVRSPFNRIQYNETTIDSSIFNEELIRLYIHSVKDIKTEKSSNLLIEIPKTSVLSFQPKTSEVKIRFTKNPEIDRKYVEIETHYEGLTLTQLFATI